MSGLEINASAISEPALVTPRGKKIYNETFDKAMKNSKKSAGYNKLMKYTEIEGYSKEDKVKIETALKNLYYGSKDAREMYDHVGNQKPINKLTKDSPDNKIVEASKNKKGETIFHIKHPDLKGEDCVDSQADMLRTTMYISPNNNDFGHYFMHRKGQDVFLSLERTIAHESSHAISWTVDNDKPPSDLEGDTVRAANKIMKQMGSKYERVAYDLGTSSVMPWSPDGCD